MRTEYLVCVWTTADPRARLHARTTGLSPPVFYYWSFSGGASVVVYSNCQCSSASICLLTYCSFYLGWPCGHLLGKNCPLGFSLVLVLFYCRLSCTRPFPIWCLGRVWNSIVSVPDHCLFIFSALFQKWSLTYLNSCHCGYTGSLMLEIQERSSKAAPFLSKLLF